MSGFIFGCVCEGQDVLSAVSEMGQEMNLVTLGLESIAERKHVDPVILLPPCHPRGNAGSGTGRGSLSSPSSQTSILCRG